jgi:predicted GIY-YIG superfamily endonuclease
MTNSIRRRVREHKLKLTPGFAAKYSITRVVYFESFQDVQNARSDAAGGRLRVRSASRPLHFQ